MTTQEKAYKHFGREYQLDKLEEELTELLLAIKYYRIRKIKYKELISEFADMLITKDYLFMVLTEDLGYDSKEVVEEEIKFKLNRTEKILERK